MITTHLPLGDVRFSAEYFSTLVGEAAKNCYGVAAMAPRGSAAKTLPTRASASPLRTAA